MAGILWFIAAVLIAIWLAGLIFDIVGGIIHVLLVIALAVIIWNFISSRR